MTLATITLAAATARGLSPAAEARGIPVDRLAGALLDIVAEEGMADAIMDDGTDSGLHTEIARLRAEVSTLRGEIRRLKDEASNDALIAQAIGLTRLSTIVLQHLLRQDNVSVERLAVALYGPDTTALPDHVHTHVHRTRRVLKRFGIHINCQRHVGYSIPDRERARQLLADNVNQAAQAGVA